MMDLKDALAAHSAPPTSHKPHGAKGRRTKYASDQAAKRPTRARTLAFLKQEHISKVFFTDQPEQQVRRSPGRPRAGESKWKPHPFYISPEAFDQIREIAFHERTKINTLILEGLAYVYKKRTGKELLLNPVAKSDAP